MSVYNVVGDPRPMVVDNGADVFVLGSRCSNCHHPVAVTMPYCPKCEGELVPARFGPLGRVWSSTVVRIPVGDRVPPYVLAYIDLDDGPRVLAHAEGSAPLEVGSQTRVAGRSAEGDLDVTPVNEPSVARYQAVRAELATPLPERYNIATVVCDTWAGDPSRVAMLVPGEDEVTELSFAYFAARSSRLADALEQRGVGRGDRVAVCLPQSPECAISHLAIARLAAIAVPISALTGTDGVEHRLKDSGAKIMITRWDSHQSLDGTPDLDLIFVGVDLPQTVTAFADLIAGSDDIRPAVDTAIEDPALIIYTSGTTGAPKGALHAHRVVPAHTEPVSLAQGGFPQPGDILWSPADWAWGGGLIDCLYAAWQAGVPIVAWRPRKFDAADVLDLLARCGVTNTFLPPTAIRMLAGADDLDARVARLKLRAIMTGGERCSPDVMTWAKEVLGLVPNEVYGQTEVSCALGSSSKILPVRPGSLGMEYPRVRAAVLNAEGNEAAVDEIGEIAMHVSTPAMFLGYWNGESAALPTGEQWHRTGDLGRRDADGYFWHEGRADDVILTSGYRVGPGEIEDCLAQHPRVSAVAVVGDPDERRGQVIAAVIELRDGEPDAALELELQELVRTRLAAYEVPRVFRFVPEIPRTESGKIKRAALRLSSP